MEIKQNEEYNENGAYTKTTITKTKKEDGWQENDIMFVTEHVPHKRYFKETSCECVRNNARSAVKCDNFAVGLRRKKHRFRK